MELARFYLNSGKKRRKENQHEGFAAASATTCIRLGAGEQSHHRRNRSPFRQGGPRGGNFRRRTSLGPRTLRTRLMGRGGLGESARIFPTPLRSPSEGRQQSSVLEHARQLFDEKHLSIENTWDVRLVVLERPKKLWADFPQKCGERPSRKPSASPPKKITLKPKQRKA